MDFLNFVIKRHAKKLVGEIRSELWDYYYELEKKKDEASNKARKQIGRLLGMSESSTSPVNVPYKRKTTPAERKMRDQIIESVKDNFSE